MTGERKTFDPGVFGPPGGAPTMSNEERIERNNRILSDLILSYQDSSKTEEVRSNALGAIKIFLSTDKNKPEMYGIFPLDAKYINCVADQDLAKVLFPFYNKRTVEERLQQFKNRRAQTIEYKGSNRDLVTIDSYIKIFEDNLNLAEERKPSPKA